MLLIEFRITGFGYNKRFQLGNPANGRITTIDLGIISFYWINTGVLLDTAHAISRKDYNFFKSVRVERKKAYKKGYAEGCALGLQKYKIQADRFEKALEEKCSEYDELRKEYLVLKAGLRELNIQNSDESRHEARISSPEVIQTEGGGILFMTPERTDEEHDAMLAQSLGWEDE